MWFRFVQIVLALNIFRFFNLITHIYIYIYIYSILQEIARKFNVEEPLIKISSSN